MRAPVEGSAFLRRRTRHLERSGIHVGVLRQVAGRIVGQVRLAAVATALRPQYAGFASSSAILLGLLAEDDDQHQRTFCTWRICWIDAGACRIVSVLKFLDEILQTLAVVAFPNDERPKENFMEALQDAATSQRGMPWRWPAKVPVYNRQDEGCLAESDKR